MRQAAQKILDTVRSNFPPAREYQRVELRDYPHLDHSFYERVEGEAVRLGFEPICDLVDLTARRSGPDPRTVVRVLARAADGAALAIYHFKPKLIWRLLMLFGRYGPARVFELETELSDGGLVESTISSKRSKMPLPESFHRRYFDAKAVSVEELVHQHSLAVGEYLETHPGAEPVPQGSFEEVVAAQNRAAAARREHLRSIGWVTRAYLRTQAGARTKLADQVMDEIQRILANEVALRRYGPCPPEPLERPPADEPDRPQSFGYGESWMAVRARAPLDVVDALGLEEPLPANWSAGLGAVRAGYTFVSPTVDGWVLVVGRNLPQCGADASEDEAWRRLLELLSQRFGEACFFNSLRVVDYYVWASYHNGAAVRVFAYLGDRGVATDRGAATAEERQRGYEAFQELPSNEDDPGCLNPELRHPDEECVMAMAAAWSVDTLALDAREETGSGWIGRLRRDQPGAAPEGPDEMSRSVPPR